MRRLETIGLGALFGVAVLTGCGGSSDADSRDATGSSGKASTSASESASASDESTASEDSSDSDDASGDPEAIAFTDDEACAWLKQELSSDKAVTGEVGMLAQLTIGLADFFDKHGGLENASPETGQKFDDATTRGCKDLHDKAVKSAGIDSFGSL